jgi:hypothetical protein
VSAFLLWFVASIAAAADSTAFGWLDDYDTLRATLASDQLESSTTAATRLAADLSADPELASAARAVADGKDLEARRTAFGSLSRIVVLRLDAAPDAPKVIVYHCTMFQGFPYWIQPKNGLVNPYMGQKMPGCGEQVSLKAAVKAASASQNP